MLSPVDSVHSACEMSNPIFVDTVVTPVRVIFHPKIMRAEVDSRERLHNSLSRFWFKETMQCIKVLVVSP